jgi:spore coat polysaccharide biosynthesis protein SpsF
MKTVAIIQARLGSTRLPAKVLRSLGGRPMIDWVVERTSQCETIDEVVVATSREWLDDPLVEHCEKQNWNVVRGSEQDVLSRYVLAAEKFQADNIVRITADCPLIDSQVVDQVVTKLVEDVRNDYACNFFPNRHYPRGLDAEAFTMETLEKVDQMAIDKNSREHVTLKIYRQPVDFRIVSICNSTDQSKYRWTVDTQEDFDLISQIIEHFASNDFSYSEIIAAYGEHPEWRRINQDVQQKVA